MPPPLSASDLQLAFERVRLDHTTSRVFVSNPFELALATSFTDAWLSRILTGLDAGQYVPSPALHVDVPKENAGIRTGSILTLEDQIVYTACVGKLLPLIASAFKWIDPAKDCSYLFNELAGAKWLRSRFDCWEQFRKRSAKKLEEGAAVVLVTDISTYYDAISIETLASDLRKVGGDDNVVKLLTTCLSRWAVINGRGIPQGFGASDILAKLYLNLIDRSLASAGYDHLRYVDDFRVFCSDRPSAKRAIVHLSQRLRRRGLNLVGAKTHVLDPAEAKSKFDGVMPTLVPLGKKYIAEIAEMANADPSYLTIAEAEEMIAKNGISPPTEMLRAAYESYVVAAPVFNKTLFRYLLNRLGVAQDDFAFDHALSLLGSYPEETEAILSYVSRVATTAKTEARLIAFLSSGDAVYAFQQFQIVVWRADRQEPASDKMLAYCRSIIDAPGSPSYLRTAARRVLGKFGNDADVEEIAASYSGASADAERAEVLCCIYRMEKSQRNAILGQAKKDGTLASEAAALVKTEKLTSVFGG
jgi:hypothetical protein